MNKEKKREQNKRYYEKNKEKEHERYKKWYEKNKEKRKQYNKQYIHIRKNKVEDMQITIEKAIEYVENENSIGNEIEYITRLLDILEGIDD